MSDSQQEPGYSKNSRQYTESRARRELDKLTTSLALADAASRKTRAKSHSPKSRNHAEPRYVPGPSLLPAHPSTPAGSTERHDSQPANPLKQEFIHSYDYFQYRVPALYHKLSNSSDPGRVFVLFTADDVKPPDGSSGGTWCKECDYLESILAKFKWPTNQGGYLIRAKVGTRDEWLSPGNPYRLDKTVRLRSIPTIVVWGTNERLAGKEVLNVNQLVALFDESIQGDLWRPRRARSTSPSSTYPTATNEKSK